MPNEFDIEDTMLMKYYGNGGKVVIPEGVTDIFFEVFTNMHIITEISVPGSTPELASFTFEGCSGLTEATLGEGLCVIGLGAFRNCTALKKIILPRSLKVIENLAFSGCTSLSEICFMGSEAEWSCVEKPSDLCIDSRLCTVVFNGTEE